MMSDHGEHHLWPFVPYCNLAALHRLVRGRAVIEVRHSYLAFLWTSCCALPLSRPSLTARRAWA